MATHRAAWVIVLAACGGDAGPAGIDAAVVDALDAPPPLDAIDAPPPPDGASDPTQLVEVLAADARVNAVVANNHHVAWAVERVSPAGAYVMLDRVAGATLATPNTSVLTVYPDGSVAYRAMEMLYPPGLGPTTWSSLCELVADPGAATLAFCFDGTVRRWAPPFTADPTFGGDGTLDVGVFDDHAVHGTTFTVAVGTSLRRFDIVTGAPRPSFGNGGQVTVPELIDLLELHPLPGDRVLMVIRAGGPDRMRLIVADADGTVHPTVVVQFGRPIVGMGVDDLGRISMFTGVTAGRAYFARFDATTGAADTSFGGDGLADFPDLPAGPGSSTGFGAVGPDGHVYVVAHRILDAVHARLR